MPAEVAPFPFCHRALGWGLGYRDKPVPPHEAVATGDPSPGETAGARSLGLSQGPDPAHSRFLRFSREEGEEMERGCCIPSFLDPPWDVLLHSWLFQSEQGSDAKPHGAAEAGAGSHCARPHLPPGLWATSVLLLLGVTGCCWPCQGAEPPTPSPALGFAVRDSP